MKLVLSRKGFDSAAGGAPSPIVDGQPVSLPIPLGKGSTTSYAQAGHGELVERATKGKIGRHAPCHRDPMFLDGGRCVFGQAQAAQRHLHNRGVGPGDVFLFFGLFAEEDTGERHHRVFGFLRVAEVHPAEVLRPELRALGHPHGHPDFDLPHNTVYRGEGAAALHAHCRLRLTRPGGPPSRWTVPPFLRPLGLTFHAKPSRWTGDTALHAAPRGQEFVCDLGDDPQARAWVEDMIALVRRPGPDRGAAARPGRAPGPDGRTAGPPVGAGRRGGTMINHVMLGVADMEASKRFYDATLGALGVSAPNTDGKGRVIYMHGGGVLMLSQPINGEPPCGANGGTVGFKADSQDKADAWHKAGVENGGTAIEDPPGFRTPGLYLAYLRDPAGNKLCAVFRPAK